MNLFILIPFGVIAIALIVFLIVKNQKDKQSFKQQINQNYPKIKDKEGDVDVEELVK